MRSCLVVLLLLAGIGPVAAQAVADDWIFDIVGAQLEGAKDHTLRSWPVDQAPYFDQFAPGDAGLDFSPSFRVIASRHGNDSSHSPANIEAPPADAGIVTYRYDTKRRRFFIRHGLNDREG
jgi:hypothetical protein